MPRPKRNFLGNQVYHVLNRANARSTIFQKPADYQAFQRILQTAIARFDLRLCSYCLMPNHWHLALWTRPDRGPDLSDFMQWLTLTHTQRHHAHHHTTGTGHLYQGRFKSFPVQPDHHLLQVFRYIEQNPLRAQLVPNAQLWPHSSLHQRLNPNPHTAQNTPTLSPWPRPIPTDWTRTVNQIPDPAELAALRLATRHDRPFGTPAWTTTSAHSHNLPPTLRPPGRPRKSPPPPENET